MDPDWKIERWQEEYVYTHIWVAHLRFRIHELPHYHRVPQVALWVDEVWVPMLAVQVELVELHQCLCACSISGDSVLFQFGKEGRCPVDFPKAWQGVFPLSSSHFSAKETQLPTASVVGLWHEFTWLGIALPLVWGTETFLRPLWPYSTWGACQTVLAVPDLLALPKWRTCSKPTRN